MREQIDEDENDDDTPTSTMAKQKAEEKREKNLEIQNMEFSFHFVVQRPKGLLAGFLDSQFRFRSFFRWLRERIDVK